MRRFAILSRFKIKQQLFFIYIFVILLPISFLSLYLFFKTKDNLIQHYDTQIDYHQNHISLTLLDITKTNYEITFDLFNNKELRNILQSTLDRNTLYKEVIQFNTITTHEVNPIISNISIYTYNKNLDGLQNFKYIDKSIEKNDWFIKAKNQSALFYITKDTINDNFPYPELICIQKIILPDINSFAIIEIKIDRNFIKNRLRNEYMDVYLKLDNYYFYSDSYRNLEFLDNLIYNDNNNSFLKNDIIYKNFTYTPYLSDNIINILIVDKYGLNDTNNIIFNMFLLLFAVFFFTFILLLLFITNFNKRINILKYEVEKALKNDYSTSTELLGGDEISQVFNHLKKIFLGIIKNEEEIYKAKLKEQQLINNQQKMEFKMLASQINPHFFYNTLETIRMKALNSGNRDVATAIKLLGKSTRYVLENTIYNQTTLEKELEYIKTYIDIQNIRFQNKIQYTLYYSSDINPKNIKILPLLIQPLIENSIIHGFKSTDYNGHIHISIKNNNDYLSFSISDNGIGLNSNEIYELNQSMLNNPIYENKIGIQNINKRLKIYYNSDGLKFKNIDNLLTVCFTIPLDRGANLEITNL